MLFTEFASAVSEIIGGELRKVEKANGVIKTAISLPTSGNASAQIYLDDFYREDMTPEEAAEKIKKLMEREKNTSVDISFFDDFEQIKPMLRARLYNKITNAEVFRPAGEPFNDLIIVPYVSGIKINGQEGAVKVKEEHLRLWGASADEVIDIAEENSRSDAEIMSMAEMLKAVMGATDVPDDGLMWVVSNHDKTCGAYAIIALLDELKERFGSFVILPSSVHEVIVVTADADQYELDSMVCEVNDTQVDPMEQLSNHAYRVAA